MAAILRARFTAVVLPALALLLSGTASSVRQAAPARALNTAEVVSRMVAMNAARRRALHAYTSVRDYTVSYAGWGHQRAAMTVRMDFRQPGPKQLTVISESGSGLLRRHVLKPLLEAERSEALASSRDGSAIVPANYRFQLLSTPDRNAGGDYILQAVPRASAARFLFRGRIWIHPGDFGIERIRGTVPQVHSFWVTRARFDYRGQKLGDFWLPASNLTRAHIRFFGHAILLIRYHDFEFRSRSAVWPFMPAGNPQ